tara:strand:+ start:72 stop:1022 length:951 start_codon:yes stop_codon:yes gene_type:complete
MFFHQLGLTRTIFYQNKIIIFSKIKSAKKNKKIVMSDNQDLVNIAKAIHSEYENTYVDMDDVQSLMKGVIGTEIALQTMSKLRLKFLLRLEEKLSSTNTHTVLKKRKHDENESSMDDSEPSSAFTNVAAADYNTSTSISTYEQILPTDKHTASKKVRRKDLHAPEDAPIEYLPFHITPGKCDGIVPAKGLFLQCPRNKEDGNAYCKKCKEDADKHNGKPSNLTIHDRLLKHPLEFHPPGQKTKTISYVSYLEKNNVSIGDVKQYLQENNIDVDCRIWDTEITRNSILCTPEPVYTIPVSVEKDANNNDLTFSTATN